MTPDDDRRALESMIAGTPAAGQTWDELGSDGRDRVLVWVSARHPWQRQRVRCREATDALADVEYRRRAAAVNDDSTGPEVSLVGAVTKAVVGETVAQSLLGLLPGF